MCGAQATNPTRKLPDKVLEKLRERRQPRRGLHLQIAEDVVFYDEEAAALGRLQHLETDMRAHVGAGRILHHGLREIEFRTMRGGELLQRRDVRPVRIARHRQHLHALQFPNML